MDKTTAAKHSFAALSICLLLGQYACASTNAVKASTDTDFPRSLVNAPKVKNGIHAAWYDEATRRYAHGVLGDAIEAGALWVQTVNGQAIELTLRQEHVFEDLAPRLADVNSDGLLDVITVRSHRDKGAQIAVYSLTDTQPQQLTLIASTPYIGTRFRWLAPVGIADFNQDGRTDIAYIDRPHLAKQLTIWSYTERGLSLLAKRSGLTNHRIGDDFITGGTRHCNGRSSMVTVDANWSQVMQTYFDNGRLITQAIGPYNRQRSVTEALRCVE